MFWRKKQEKKAEIDFSGQKNPITEEKRASIIINYLADGILFFDEKEFLVLANPMAEKIFEVRTQDILGKHIFKLNKFSNFEPIVSLLGGGLEDFKNREVTLKNKLIIEVSSISLKVGERKIGILVIIHNITREKVVEKSRMEFITLATHQLRTPTSGIKWSLRMVLDGDLGELSEIQNKMISQAYNNNDKVIKLINNLLKVSRIEEGADIRPEPTLSDIETILNSVIDSYKNETKGKGIKIKFVKDDSLDIPKIMIDKDRVFIAIENVIDNSVRYTMKGGKIKVFLSRDQDNVLIKIQDNGLGIPDREQRKIFTKFFRASNILRVDTEGTGLGLYISKSIIEYNGGRIWFESEENRGTSVFISFPIKKSFAEYLSKDFY